jgi:hypothetical protein
MARGKKPPNPLYEADGDLLEHLEIVEAIGNGASIELDAPVRRLTAVSFGRIAEGAVEQNASVIRQGKVGEFRNRARRLIEGALAEECFVSGMRKTLNLLFDRGDISRAAYTENVAIFHGHYEDMWRKAALQCALILIEIEAMRIRKGRAGRPPQSANGDALARLLDSSILKDAANSVLNRNDYEAILAAIPTVVREHLRLGNLRMLGETEQEAVDRHSKRIRASFDALIKNPPRGGSSIIRKAQ